MASKPAKSWKPAEMFHEYNEKPFEVRKVRSRADGYGNRHQLVCTECGELLMDVDPGNGSGYEYARRWMAAAAREHKIHSDKEA